MGCGWPYMATMVYGPCYTVVCIPWFINVIQAKVRDKLEYKNNSNLNLSLKQNSDPKQYKLIVTRWTQSWASMKLIQVMILNSEHVNKQNSWINTAAQLGVFNCSWSLVEYELATTWPLASDQLVLNWSFLYGWHCQTHFVGFQNAEG